MNKKQWSSLFLSIVLIFSVSPIKAETNQTTEPQVSAESVILMDADTKTVLYEKNANEKHYPASITKLMTALLAIENLSPTDTITFSKDAIFGIERGSSHIGIDVDEQLTVDQALHGLLMMSANEVANGLAEAVSGSIDAFAERMTERAKELGAKNTHFVNPHGLHNENHYTTAYDMALIGSYLAENDTFLNIMKDTSYQIPATNKTDEIRYLYQQHRMLNKARGFDPNSQTYVYREDVIGGKTGFTDQARHTLVTMAKQGNTTLVAVVLQSEKNTLYTDTIKLLDYGFSSYSSLPLHTSNDVLKTLPTYSVKSGQSYQSANCGIGLNEDVSVIVSKDITADDITLSFNLPESIDATSAVGDVVGSVSFILNSKELAKKDLVIKQIDLLPEPKLSFYQTYRLPIYWIGGIIVTLLVFTFIFLHFAKKRNKRKNYLKMNKLFK